MILWSEKFCILFTVFIAQELSLPHSERGAAECGALLGICSDAEAS